ncbi:hypothetical protein Hanom_Chr10g00905291 [Helianthus anomalus]
MAEQNPSLHIDGESSSFELHADTAHVQGHQRNETVREQVNNEIHDLFGSTSRVINQTTLGVNNQTPPGIINQTTPGVQTPNHGFGPSAPSAQAQLNFSAILGLPEEETLASWYTKQTTSINMVYT